MRPIDSYAEHPNWWLLVQAGSGRSGFIATRDQIELGFVDLKIDDDVASLAVFVRPEMRGRHLGRALLGAGLVEFDMTIRTASTSGLSESPGRKPASAP